MKSHWQQKIGLKHPVVQAGMGGGLATSELVIAVCRAGGLGTLGLLPPEQFRYELKTIRKQCNDQPFAANLLMPFVREAHVKACLESRPAVVSLFYGYNRSIVGQLKAAGIIVWHQVGNELQAIRAIEDGADGLIAQGEEAGGHLAGTIPLRKLLPSLQAIAGDRPVLAAGGIHDAKSSKMAYDIGADGVVSGTRFLLTPESHAHPSYKNKLLMAHETIRTDLFGLAWPAPHRVIQNAATRRWCKTLGNGPSWVRILNSLMIPTRRLLPMESVMHLVNMQRVELPLFLPAAITKNMDSSLVSVTPLYAGMCVGEISELLPAADVVRELANGFCPT